MNVRALVVSLAAMCMTTPAFGDFIIGNLNGPDSPGTLFGPNATTQFKAVGFTMTGTFALDDVMLAIDLPDAGATADVEIWTGAGAPSAFLAQLTGPVFNGAGDYAFTPTSQLTLNAGTTYWVYLNNANPNGEFQWAGSTDSPAGPHANFVGYNFNGNPSSFMNRFEVNGSTIPAPSAAALLGLGLFGVARRRRR